MKNYENELKKLRDLFNEGVYTPSFYNKKLSDIHQLDSYETFCKIPFTYKNEIRNTSIEERTTTKPGEIYGVFSSSGTTGAKTFYIYNKNDKRVHEEFVKTFFTELGVEKTDIGGIMAPVDTGVMAHTMMWQFTTMGAGYVNCPIPSPDNIIDTVTKVPVTLIATRPSIASSVAYDPKMTELAQKSHVRKLLMGGGFLSDQRRKLLEKTWNAECYNLLGMSEMFGPMAGECRERNGLHYLNQYLMIEIVDPETGDPVEEGQPGVAVYTTLWNKGFPLLRYWTDDVLVISEEPCKCGSTYPRLFYLGRLADCYVIDGKYVFPENVENILFEYGYIGEYHVDETENGFAIKSEGLCTEANPEMIEKLEKLLHGSVTMEFVAPGSLRYDGHARRFSHLESKN